MDKAKKQYFEQLEKYKSISAIPDKYKIAYIGYLEKEISRTIHILNSVIELLEK